MPKISQIDEVPCQAEVRILQKITLNLLTLSGIQRQADILDVNVRGTTSETFYSVKISVARATQLGRLIVGNAG